MPGDDLRRRRRSPTRLRNPHSAGVGENLPRVDRILPALDPTARKAPCRWGRWRRCVPLGLLWLTLGLGCAGYHVRMAEYHRALAQGDDVAALRAIERAEDQESVLWHAEHAMLLGRAGRFEESIASFHEARRIQEELFTRSLSNEGVSLVLADALRPYRAPLHETGFFYLYPALRYATSARWQPALIEARALSQELQFRVDEGGDVADWGLGRLLAGLIFEAGGEWDDAAIAYRAALTAYQARPARGQCAIPPPLIDALRRLSSFIPESDTVAATFARGGGTSCGSEQVRPGSSPSDGATLVLWIEEGMLPPIEELRLRVPILEEEKHWDAARLDGWSRNVGERARWMSGERRHGGHHDHRRPSIDVLLDIALPVRPSRTTPPLRVRLAVESSEPSHLLSAFEVESVEDLAAAAFEERQANAAVRAAARSILKYLATKGAERKTGDLGGTLVNILGVATEQADTRSWVSLPSRIALAVVPVPAGDVRVALAGAAEARFAESAIEVEAKPGEWRFVMIRLPAGQHAGAALR